MKNQQLIVLALAGVAVYLVIEANATQARTAARTGTAGGLPTSTPLSWLYFNGKPLGGTADDPAYG